MTGDGALDEVVDDGSRDYGPARLAFETDFPRLRPGGRYVLEAWNWAHREAGPDGKPPSPERPALTNLLAELLVVAGTDPSVVAQIVVEGDRAVVVRGHAALTSPMRLTDHYRNRGIRFRPLL